jgi:Ca2+-binding RTX toxin-like protein
MSKRRMTSLLIPMVAMLVLFTGAAVAQALNLVTCQQGVPCIGTSQDDELQGTSANDRQYGLGGSDTINGLGGADQQYGDMAPNETVSGAGNDTINGLGGADQQYGDAGNDSIDGGGGADQQVGGAGTDTILGGSGNDTIDVEDGEADVVDCGETRRKKDRDKVFYDLDLDTISRCEVKIWF